MYLGQGLNLLFYYRYYKAEGDALRTIKYNVECVAYGLVKDRVIVVKSFGGCKGPRYGEAQQVSRVVHILVFYISISLDFYVII